MNRPPQDCVHPPFRENAPIIASSPCQPIEERDLFRELQALERCGIGYRHNDDLRLVLVRRMCRRIESLRPGRFAHGEQTVECALALGHAAGLDARDLGDLRFAALLHDIGLITVPAHLLTAPGPLSADEYAALQSHPRAAADLLQPFPFLQPAAVLIAHHHERWDGSGYPFGLRGPLIPLGARILAIADTFEMLVRRARAREDDPLPAALAALRILAGSQLDPNLAALFLNLLLPTDSAPPAHLSFLVESQRPASSRSTTAAMGSHRFDESFFLQLRMTAVRSPSPSSLNATPDRWRNT